LPNALSFDVDELEPTMRESADLPLIDSPAYLVENTEFTLAMLRDHGARATFFINGLSVAPHAGLIQRIADDGHEIGVHSFSHRFLHRYQSAAEFREDVVRCIELIEGETGVRPIGYRAPGLTLYRNPELALDVLRDLGFEYSSSLPMVGTVGHHGYYAGPDGPFVWSNGLIELPPSGLHLAGFRVPVYAAHFLRLLPYWCTAAGLRRLNADGQTSFVYAHSFEFFDQPVTRRCRWANASHRIYLLRRGPQMARKMNRLLSEFEFAPYRDFLDGTFAKGDFEH
jgi:peptidoglycan/xylan/chitin deacetylase (PgdA/CDA1 family)